MIRCASLFSQLIGLFDRHESSRLVLKHHAERYAKSTSSWDQFVAMLFCQLSHAKSLREICGGLAYCLGKLRHLGMNNAPKKSTLSYANAHRPWEMFKNFGRSRPPFLKGFATAFQRNYGSGQLTKRHWVWADYEYMGRIASWEVFQSFLFCEAWCFLV